MLVSRDKFEQQRASRTTTPHVPLRARRKDSARLSPAQRLALRKQAEAEPVASARTSWLSDLVSLLPRRDVSAAGGFQPIPPLAARLILCDVFAVVAVLAVLKGLGVDSHLLAPHGAWSAPQLWAWLFVAVAPLAIGGAGGYRDRHSMWPTFATLRRLCLAAAMLAWLVALAPRELGQPAHMHELAVIALAMPAVWWLARGALAKTAALPAERVVIVGSGSVARRATEQAHSTSLQVIGWIDDDPGRNAQDPSTLGRIDELPRIIREHKPDRVLVAFPNTSDADLLEVLRECDACGVEVDIVPRLLDYVGMTPSVHMVGDLPLLHVCAQRARFLARLGKRVTDVCMAGTLLIVTLPGLAVIAVALAVCDGRPILYRQRRVGRGGREFDILKFRTLKHDADEQGLAAVAGLEHGSMSVSDAVATLKAHADARATPLGAFLRRTSLDELPQLWNVLRGDMSMVGPRPLRPFEVDTLSAWQLSRHNVRPGITGLWQVLGRSNIPWEQRMQLDYTYVRHWHPAADLRILALTLPAVIARRGAQ